MFRSGFRYDEIKKRTTLLVKAIKNDDIEEVQSIVKNGFNINEKIGKDDTFYTPLGLAISYRNLKIIRYLVSQKADTHKCKITSHESTSALTLTLQLAFNSICDLQFKDIPTFRLMIAFLANNAEFNNLNIPLHIKEYMAHDEEKMRYFLSFTTILGCEGILRSFMPILSELKRYEITLPTPHDLKEYLELNKTLEFLNRQFNDIQFKDFLNWIALLQFDKLITDEDAKAFIKVVSHYLVPDENYIPYSHHPIKSPFSSDPSLSEIIKSMQEKLEIQGNQIKELTEMVQQLTARQNCQMPSVEKEEVSEQKKNLNFFKK